MQYCGVEHDLFEHSLAICLKLWKEKRPHSNLRNTMTNVLLSVSMAYVSTNLHV